MQPSPSPYYAVKFNEQLAPNLESLLRLIARRTNEGPTN
jgi:hypothetical protein